MGAALAARRVDAAFLIEPYLTQAETRAGDVPLFDIDQGATQDFPLTGYVVTDAWLAKYPRTAAAFTRALGKGQPAAQAAAFRELKQIEGPGGRLTRTLTFACTTGRRAAGMVNN